MSGQRETVLPSSRALEQTVGVMANHPPEVNNISGDVDKELERVDKIGAGSKPDQVGKRQEKAAGARDIREDLSWR